MCLVLHNISHYIFSAMPEQPKNSSFEEFEVLIAGDHVIFSWNSPDISYIARTLGTPEMDNVPCG